MGMGDTLRSIRHIADRHNPRGIPRVGWLDDALAVVGGGLNLIQANLAKTNETLAGIIKFVKWTTIILGGILVAVVALLGVGIYNIIK